MRFGNAESSLKEIKYGVPQGSILGPLLFLLYVNDIVLIPGTQDIVLYADDPNVFFSGADLSKTVTQADIWMKEFSLWLRINQLALNIDKTSYIIFRAKNKPIDNRTTLIFEGKPLKQVSSQKFLCVYFQEYLSWTEHDYLCVEISRTVGMLNRFRSILPIWFKRQLYYTMVYSRLYYCSLVWGTMAKSNRERILVLQKKCVRFIENLLPGEHTRPSFQKHKILKIESIYLHRLAIRIYNDLNAMLRCF